MAMNPKMNSPLNMRRQWATLSFALASTLGAVCAQAQTPTAPLNFDEALRIAVATHPTVVSRRNDMQAANARLDAAMRQRYPGFQAQTGKDSSGSDVSTMRLERTLWNGGRTAADIEAAEAGIRSSSASVVLAQQEIMGRVITAFTDLGRVRTRQLVAQSNVLEHERLAALIGRRVESQISPMSDGTMANARLAQARAELNQLSALAERAQSSLTQALGKPVTEIQTPNFPDLSGTNDFLIRQKALDYAPALRRLNAEEDVLTADIAARKSALWPQLKLRAEKNSGGAVNKSQVYVTLDYQTGAGFAVQAQIQEGFAKLDSLRASKEAAERDALETINADLADLKSQQMQLKDLRDQVAATTEVFDSSIRQYSVGRKTWVDVLNAQREVSQSRYAQADAEWGYLRSAMRVNLSTGDLNPESMDKESTTAKQ